MAEGGGDDSARDIGSAAHNRGGGVNRCGGDIIGNAAGEAKAQHGDGGKNEDGAHEVPQWNWSVELNAEIDRAQFACNWSRNG